MRIVIDIPDTQVRALATISERTKQPRAAIVRAAIAEYLARHGRAAMVDGFGQWDGSGGDGLAYQEKLRAEW
jgi:predicted transcriptional regulator